MLVSRKEELSCSAVQEDQVLFICFKKGLFQEQEEERTGVVFFNQKNNQKNNQVLFNQGKNQKKNQVLFKKRRPRC